MANNAFALSPMSARAASPNEADFEAIREAFVETARGRWFLDEYTKRNRNADTAMVLDAVARIERTLAAQKEPRDEPQPQEQQSSDLLEVMAAARAIITAARTSAETVLSDPSSDEALAPSRKCARVIREIAWGLRESGADGRICALLESQVDAIDRACDHASVSGFRDRVLNTYDLALQQIDGMISIGATQAESIQSTAAPASEVTPAVSPDEVSSSEVAETPLPSAAISQMEAVPQEAASAEADHSPPLVSSVHANMPPEAAVEPLIVAEEAPSSLLAAAAPMPAEEMQSILPDEDLFDTGAGVLLGTDAALTPISEGLPTATVSITGTDMPPAVIAQSAMMPLAEPDAAPVPQASLGASLIASGIIPTPAASLRSDPLAAIRRMSHAEKIAFFS